MKSLASNLPGLQAAGAIYLVSALATLPWLVRALRDGRADRATWMRLALVGTMLTSVFNLALSMAASELRGTTIGAIVALEPLMIAFLASLFTRRLPEASTWIALLLSIAGVWALITPAAPTATATDASWAIATVLAGAGIWSLAAVIAPRLRTPWPPLQTSMVMVCCGSLPAIPLVFLLGMPATVGGLASAGVGILFMALAATVAANALWLRSLVDLGPVRAGLLISLIPAVTVVLAVVFLGEAWGLRQMLGTGLILGGLLCTPLVQWFRPGVRPST
jgi:drug/metabolite transporter (DMT)-like permease